jgi:acyl dehydratase
MLPEEIKSLVGQVFSTSVFEINKESIRRFADAVGDRNPLYRDEEYAAGSKYGSIIAPPGYNSSVRFWESPSEESPGTAEALGLFGLIDALAQAGYRSILDSGIDYEFFEPIKAGDIITSTAVVKDIKERKSEDGSMVFLVTDTTYTNQNGDKVATTRWMTIHR